MKMNKKRFLVAVFLISLIGGIYFLSSSSPSFNGYCAFCDSAVINRQKFYEDELVIALYTHKPVLPGHCLVIPKRHVERFEMLTDTEILQMGKVLKKVNAAATKVFDTSSYLLLQKNGVEVGQTVPHVHFHYIPRKSGDHSTIGFLLKMFIANAKSPISSEEMRDIVEKMKQMMNERNEGEAQISRF